jgi:tRNA A-37 threonylcarbamoyl transferase component Bud32
MANEASASLGRRLGIGKEAEVFEFGNLAAKIYGSAAAKRRAFREGMNLAVAESLRLPVPAVWNVRQLDGRWALVMDRVSGPSVAELLQSNPDTIHECIEQMVRLQLRVHACRPVGLSLMKTRLVNNIRTAVQLDETDKGTLLAGVATMPDGESLCHGDFHPKNLIASSSRLTIIIDWLDAGQGDAAADVCRSYLLLKLYAPELAAPYLGSYTRLSGISDQRVSRWMPFVAAARLAEGVASETDHLLEMVYSGTAISSSGPYC